ncbi:TlpA disulfide reductase family protein [Solitalea koreensis]|uniref:Thiol-disulfide isomerase or thioredoxin n=1 Tax=Solitalea koreensis TaxID=543615 RepID=A0A521AV79_9SPHI|nr:TlpA disulfide reductase family protein [Solitalea koreensis]SMO38719.1 Thiol-disulfide isomerase or thioredoxin [Solitalea koreensis]
MKTILLSLFCLFIAGEMCAQTNTNFVLNGKIKNLKDGEKVSLLAYKFSKGEKIDTLCSDFVKNGCFKLQGSVSHPSFYYLYVRGNLRYPLFIENSKMELAGDSLKAAKLSGSKTNDEFVSFKQTTLPIEDELLRMAKSWPKENAHREEDRKKAGELASQKTKLIFAFVNTHPNSFVSPALLLTNGTYELDPVVYSPIYDKFSEAVKNSYAAKTIKSRLDKATKIKVGDIAPSFSAQTPDRKELSLAAVLKESKLTLIDFWASWCGPCRTFGAELIPIYNRFHAKGLNVLSVSVDDSADKWKNAIKADNYPWYHVSELKGFHSEIPQAYAISFVPATFLVDQNGKIIAKNPTIEQLEQLFGKTLNAD